ncbi:MAG: ParB/RepB/Spo0J family partition protein [Planctomycetes bacterium]|nr:ParB/RepB/Spo0J family partition protein [Planctomycetota bacterium]
MMLELSKLAPSPFQPRKHIDEAELQTLAESIRASGILQPILARRVDDRFEIVAGERRWRAAKLAGLSQAPVLVRAITDQESAVFGLVENLQREDLNAIEKAQGFQLLMSKLSATQEEVAKKVGFERSTVANFLRLLDLPEPIQAHVSRGTLSMGHARTLLALPDAETMVRSAEECIRQGWSVRALEAQVKAAQEASMGAPSTSAPAAAANAKSKGRPVWLNEVEESLRDNLSTPVQVRYSAKRSKIVIECAGRAEFERVLDRLKNA